MNAQHVNLVEKTLKDVIDAEIKECDEFLGDDLEESLNDFVTGFRKGLVSSSKKQLIGKGSLFQTYGDLRAKENKEYVRKKIRIKNVRGLKGEIHAVASVISLVNEAIRQSVTIIEDKDKAKTSLLNFIVREASLGYNG